jgi:proline iminopeptidase
MPTLDIDGTSLYYLTVGAGKPALVLHGGLGLDHSHLRSLDVLAGIYSLTYYDHRGNGRSGRPPLNTITFESLAADADRLRQALGHEKITLIGSSFGGAVALQYALQFPERVAGLILLGTVAKNSGDVIVADLVARGVDPAAFAPMADPACTDEQIREVYRAVFPAFLHAPTHEKTDSLIDATIFSAQACQRSFALFETYDVRSRVQEITVPALVITGASELPGNHAGSSWLGEALPNGTAIEIESAGHLAFIDQPEELREAVLQWLQHERLPSI